MHFSKVMLLWLQAGIPENVVTLARRISHDLDQKDQRWVAADDQAKQQHEHLVRLYDLGHKIECLALQSHTDCLDSHRMKQTLQQLKSEARKTVLPSDRC